MFSTIFLIHTALLLGQGQLHQTYGISQRDCQNELYRTGRLAQETNGTAFAESNSATELSARIVRVCYKNKIAANSGIVHQDADDTND